MIYVKYDTDIKIMTKVVVPKDEIFSLLPSMSFVHIYQSRYKWCHGDVNQNVLGQIAHLQYPTNVKETKNQWPRLWLVWVTHTI